MKKVLAVVCLIILIVGSAGCNLLNAVDLSSYNVAVTDFAVRLLQTEYDENKNVLISPIAALSGVSQITNDMDEEMIAQIEETLGMTSEELNKFIYTYTNYLSRISNRKTKAYIEELEMNQENYMKFEGVWDHAFGCSENKMYDRVDYSLEGEDINGFVKFFEKERYALGVLLPNENVDMNTYITNLTGEKLYSILSNPVEMEADIRLPKVVLSDEMNFKDVFLDMVVTDGLAEGMETGSDLGESFAEENIKHDDLFCISSINMTSNGINTEREASPPPVLLTYEPPNSVYVDRPFIIIIMDCKYNIPLLIGTIIDV